MRILTIISLLMMSGSAFANGLTTTHLVRPATIILPGHLTKLDGTYPNALDETAQIIGLEARVTLYPGRPIKPGDVGPAALIERNEIVSLVFRRGGLLITAEGRALSRGAIGQTVRAMNLGSRSTVSGRVSPDGHILVVQ